ncbi:MAG: hypothetical protein U0932_04900 [Thiobacillus sp.]|nr:hypothetical protein [Thiobacillus sp.]
MQLKTYQSTTILASVLLVLGIVAYWAALYGFFLSDDFVHVQYLQRMDADINVLLKNFWSNWLDVPTTLFYRPLISVTLYLDHLIWGWRPLGYHLTNILMHGGNGILVFLLAQRITADRTAPPPLLFPFLGGMLFLIWPLHPEAVYWIIGRVDVQVTFFYLLSIYLFVLYAGDLRKRAWLWGSLLSFVAALLSKEPAVTLPAVLAAYALFFLSFGQGSIFKRAVVALRVTMPFWGALALYFLWRWHVLGTFGGGYTGGSVDYFSADYWGRWTALAYLLAPINKAWPASASHKDVTTSLFLISWCAIAVAACWKLSPSASSKLLFGLAAFTISLLPLAPVFHVAADLQSSRFLYLPAAFLWITVAGVLNVQSKNPGSIAMRAGIAALVLLIVLSVYQLRLNLQPWVQASKDIKLLSSSLSDIAAERERNTSGSGLMVLVGIPDNFFGAQFLRNGYGGFFSTVFHQNPIINVMPLTDDDRTGLMPIHAKNLAARASERLYGVYRYVPVEGFKRVNVEQNPAPGKNSSSTCTARVDDSPARNRLNDLVYEGGHWRITGPDPSVLFEINGCHAGDIDALRLSLAYASPAAINNKDGSIQVFWRGTATSFSEDRSMTMPVIADGAMHAYTMPVKSSAKWDSNQVLGELRLDFPGQPGGRVNFGTALFLLNDQQTTFPQYSGARLEALDVSRFSGTTFDPVRGVLTLDIQKSDEFLLLPRDAWNPVHGDLFTIRMRISNVKQPGGRAKLYWTTDKASAFSEDKSIDFFVTADNQWHTYAIPLKYLPAWWTNGEGRQLRLNPYYGQAKVEISSISLGSTTPLPRLTLLDDGNIGSIEVFRRVNRRQAEMVQLAYQTLDGYTNSVLLASKQPFPNPNLPDEIHTLEFKRNLPGMSGIIKITPDQFNGPGMRYLRVLSIDSHGQPSQFTSDPIALLVEN